MRLSDVLTCDDGALLEPLSVACHAVRRAQVVPASSCLIIGAGAVGLLCAAVARFKGCSRIAICDIDKRRVDFALRSGFAQIGLAVERQLATNVEEELANAQAFARDIAVLSWPDGGLAGRFSIVFECTGVPSCVQSSIYVSSQLRLSCLNYPLIHGSGCQVRRPRHAGWNGNPKPHLAIVRSRCTRN